jgi:ketosteroid isomerase-like protein
VGTVTGGADDAPARPPGADETDLRGLSLAYAAAADARDGDALVDLFVDDGALVVPRYPVDMAPVVTRSGPDALRQVAEMLGRYDRTFHVVGDTRFALEGEEASGEVQCVAHHVTAVGSGAASSVGSDMVWFIRYRDRYRRSATGWKIVRRELHLQWVEEHPVSAVGAPFDRGAPLDRAAPSD